ncbi:hypothetical protein L6164_030490 [Bauhinia variegata]|uniref:Uncharacterized protein n=1 Tax=Bauhinia variegata TaxID=167791 RepID=A0ACB9LBY2_BAUVA|nr:hypothetical protein L6164_030490 [Bauhinia variegata]
MMGEILCGGSLGKVFTKAKPYLLMVGLQFGLAGTFIFTMASLSRGMNRFVFIVYRNAIAAFALAPFAFFFERKIRPKMTISVFLQIMALGFLEPVIDQGFTFLGMQYTSASFASAIINAVPSITFVLAVILRLERVKIKELRSQAKVLGTLHQGGSQSPHAHWLTGTLFILLGCVAWSSFYILQSITVKKYPAELSLASLICLMGALQSAAVALVVEHHPRAWAIGWDYRFFCPLYTGIVSSGIAYYVQGLVLQSRGPVFVTAFNPLCMIITAALGSFLLAEQIHLGSVIGGIVIALGLYSVVWGKGKDYPSDLAPRTTVTQQQLPITTIDICKSCTDEKTNHHQQCTK